MWPWVPICGEVGVDGLAVVVGKNSRAHDCLTSPDVGGAAWGSEWEWEWEWAGWGDERLRR